MDPEVKKFLLDTGPLGELCHPDIKVVQPRIRLFVEHLKQNNHQVFLSEIADYELRRKFLHLAWQNQQQTSRRLKRLDKLRELFDYLPVTTVHWQKAAELWAIARLKGERTSGDNAIDADVILAAQALLIGGTVITKNPKHLSRFVATIDWQTFL